MDPSIDLIKASDGSGNAAVATVQSTRAPEATTIEVDTVTGIPATFIATMGTPHTFIDPVTSEEITVISEATAVDFIGHVDGSDLEIDEIAPGYVDAGSEVDDIVIIRPTTVWADRIAEVLEVSHADDGALKLEDGAAIEDGNGNELIKASQTASAVNEFTVGNATAGNAPYLQATGDDTNIDANINTKGTGKFNVNGAPLATAKVGSNISISASTSYVDSTEEVPLEAGVWLIIGAVRWNCSVASTRNVDFEVYDVTNATQLFGCSGRVDNDTTNNNIELGRQQVITLVDPTTIVARTRISSTAGSQSVTGRQLICVRLASVEVI